MYQIKPQQKTLIFSYVTELLMLVHIVMRYPDLMSIHHFLWGHMKEMAYWLKLQTGELLQQIMESTIHMKGNHKTIRKATKALLRHRSVHME
jgi:hypothetical protein